MILDLENNFCSLDLRTEFNFFKKNPKFVIDQIELFFQIFLLQENFNFATEEFRSKKLKFHS